MMPDHEGIMRQIVDAVTTIITPGPTRVALCLVCVNHTFYMPGEESLLTPVQVQWAGNTVDTTAKRFGGSSKILIDDFKIPLYFDGMNVLFHNIKPKHSHQKLKHFDLTSQTPYLPKHYVLRPAQENALDKPQAPPHGEAEEIINPLWLTPTGDFQDAFVPHKRRRYIWNPSRHIWKPYQLAEWEKRLAFVPELTIKQTFLATMQLVPLVQHKNELFPKNAQQARFPILANRRLKKCAYCDVV